MIRVAHLIQSADTRAGGTTTAFFNILTSVRAAAGKGGKGGGGGELDVHAYFLRPPEGDPAWKEINADPARFHLADSTGRRLLSGHLAKIIRDDLLAKKYDLLHIHGLWSPDLVVAARAAHTAGVPYLWQSHGMFIRWAWNYKRLKKRVFLALGLQKCLERADSFILMTHDELEQSVYPRTITADKRHLVPLPVDMPAAAPRRAELAARGRERFKIPAASPVLAFMGRLHPVKRVEMTIEAFALAVKTLPDMRLLLLGKGETDEYEQGLRAKAAALGVTDRVIFAGWVLGEDKLAGLSAASALVLNSVVESFGYVLFEAIGAGTPVVVTENIALARDFRAAHAGLIAPNSVEGLAQTMIAAVTDPDAPASAERARAWARHEFSHAAVGNRFLALYRAAAKR
jgi:glycosyltransferase involved in cell wall biosynthesis